MGVGQGEGGVLHAHKLPTGRQIGVRRAELLKTVRGAADAEHAGVSPRTMTTPSHVETVTMSDKPQGPGWWLASDGTWHPPELHPSLREDASSPRSVESASPVPVPARAPASPVAAAPTRPAAPPQEIPSLPVARKRPTWSGESDHRPEAGPMYPDLFKQAVAGSALADVVTVTSLDRGHRSSPDIRSMPGPADDHELVSASGSASSGVGDFTGASARKRRWRF